jgi:hypothetical protein
MEPANVSTSQASTYCLLSQTHASSTMSSLPISHHNYSPNPLVVTKYNSGSYSKMGGAPIQGVSVHIWGESFQIIAHVRTQKTQREWYPIKVKTIKSLLTSELKRGRKGIYPIKVRTFKSWLMSELKKRENGRSTRSSSRWLILLPWILRSTFKDASTACLIYRKHKAQWWFKFLNIHKDPTQQSCTDTTFWGSR